MTASQPGTVYLVGAGPGDPELLTLKAARLLGTADVVLHDDLVPAAVLAHAERALVINVGKRCGRKNISQEQINAMMIDYARRGLSVIRLKSGDPLVFGRAGEEMDALRAGGIFFEVIPGITAAFAAAAALHRPLTDRRSASSIRFSSGHHADGSKLPPASLSAATRVVYMPGRDLAAIAAELRSEGLGSDLPCVIVSRAGQPQQQIVQTTLAQLERIPALPAPSILLAGETLRDAQTGEVEKIAGYALADAESRPDSLEF
ncbi:MAG: uroporphyrinogen-III C-methyltransferase [Acidobacteriaceae bacterium]|jgi:uroporphyrin-III C-methyltransferase